MADAVANARAALDGLEGLDASSFIAVNDRALVTGTVYSIDDLTKCVRYEADARGAAICAARLHSAAATVHAEHGWYPHASLEVVDDPSGTSIATVRFGDVPVLRAMSVNRKRLLSWTTAFVARVNRISTEITRNAHLGKPYPVTFHTSFGPKVYELRGSWNFDQGRGGDLVATVPVADLEAIAAVARVPPQRLFGWWTALLQDAFRLYLLSSRPMQTEVAGGSPLAPMYERSLAIRRAKPDTTGGNIALPQAYFALRLASGQDPFESVLTTIPPAFAASGSLQ